MKYTINRAIIAYWMILNPVKLFQHINELDWYRNTLHNWVDDLSLAANTRMLEVACATGALTEYLASNGINATGIDSSSKMIKAALSNHARRAKYRCADAKSLPFIPSSFDTVISASLLNVASEPKKILAQMTRVCKHGGTVSVLVPRHGFRDSEIVELTNSTTKTAFSAAALTTWHRRAPKMHSRELIDLFSQAGLVAVKEKHYLGSMVTTVSGIKH